MATTINSQKEEAPLVKSDTAERARVDHLHMPADHMENLYDSKNPLVKFVHLNRLESISDQIPTEEEQKILDAGCGEGHLLEKINHLNTHKHY